MRITYIDCFAGIAGDMFLGALLGAGVPEQVLSSAAAALNLNASLKLEKVDRSGISSLRVQVLENGHPAEDPAGIEQQSSNSSSLLPRTQHEHKTGVPHIHNPANSHTHAVHQHGRTLTDIRHLIQSAPLSEPVKAMAVRTFELLGASEAKIHNLPLDRVHFHEVGAVDAIVDIVCACAGIQHLDIAEWYCSPVNVGGGTVECAHGTFPVPAPAAADLLTGMPTYSARVQKELVTPTGAALLRMLSPTFGPQPQMRVAAIGYGAGTRNPVAFPNVLRLLVGEAADAASSLAPSEGTAEQVAVLETAVDDMSPQLLAHVAGRALAEGALDTMLTPVIMKKGRPGTLLTVLCNPSEARKFERLLLTETTTLGVRIRNDRRSTLERKHVTTETEYGPIRIKLGSLQGELLNVAPEFEDCRAAAAAHSVPVKQVQQAAIAAYLRQTKTKGQPHDA